MATPLTALWLPILLSGVALFFASWIAWMFLPHHKTQWQGLPNEQAFLSALKGVNIPPGQYCYPHPATPEEWKSEEFKHRVQAGPNGTITIWKKPPNMGVNMLCTFLFFT